ncbi:hypothetical protein GCM10010246_78070 [Streptomyces cuspidosporus]|uniref:Uncharacterized protein n=1 Tax=Streptomyces cuspidosporus TaxID=66882 RepID=A0ABP5U7Y7_9ACTN
MRLKPLLTTRRKGIVATLTLALGPGIWWATHELRSDTQVANIPQRICHNRISSEKAAPLLPTKGSKYTEDADTFGGWSSLGTCEVKADDSAIYVAYQDALGHKRNYHPKGIPVSLGKAHGSLTTEGAINLYVSCINTPRTVTKWLLIGANATVVDREVEAGKKLNRSTRGLRALTEFTAQAVRDLTQDWFKCPGADQLPDGPVTIHWDKPAVP